MHANPEAQRKLGALDLLLELEPRLDRSRHAVENRKRAVTHRVEDPALSRDDGRREEIESLPDKA
jgi:hypothetical protein